MPLSNNSAELLTYTTRRHVYNPSAQARLDLLRDLATLPCALTKHFGEPCTICQPNITVDSARTCMTVVTSMLDGTPQEVTPSVRKAAYTALARSVRHHSYGPNSGELDYVAQLAVRGMKDSDRNVRLSAG